MATNAILAPGWRARIRNEITDVIFASTLFNGSKADADNLAKEAVDKIETSEEAEDADSDLDSDGS